MKLFFCNIAHVKLSADYYFFLSVKKLRCCTTCITDMAVKCLLALLLLGTFCLFVCFFLGGGEGGFR